MNPKYSLSFKQQAVEAALNAELATHLGYEKIDSNSRNGFSSKRLQTEEVNLLLMSREIGVVNLNRS